MWVSRLVTKSNSVPRRKQAILVVACLLVPLGTLLGFVAPNTAQAATSSTITFQGRLLSSTGTTVPDGSYNMQFNLYTVSSGGSTQWTDTRLVSATQGIVLKNGYFSVNLGDTSVGGTAFPSTINWDQEQWLGMTVRGSTSCVFGSCVPTDGEMTPRFKLTAVPYAFSAGQLQKTNGSFTSTVNLTTPTANRTILFPDAGGTAILQTSTFTTNGVVYANANSTAVSTAAGTTGQCLVATTGSAPTFGSCAGTGSGSTLQAAYGNGNTITTTDARNLAFTLADTTTDSNLLVNIATGSSSKFAVQDNGTDALSVTNTAVNLAKNTSISGTNTFTVGTGATTLGGNLTVDTTTFAVDATNNRVGIGNATPTYVLDVRGTVTGSNTLSYNEATITSNTGNPSNLWLQTNVAPSATGSTNTYYGLYNQLNLTNANFDAADIIYASQNNLVLNDGVTDSLSALVGVNSQLEVGDLYTVGTATSYWSHPLNVDGTVTSLYGFYASSSVGTGTPTNQYGVYVENLTDATNDYGIYIQGADTYALFVDAGAVRFDGTIDAQGAIANSTGDLVLNDQLQLGGATGLQVTTAGVITDIDGASVQIGENLTVSTGGITITTGDLAITAGNLTTGGTQRLSNTGALSNISTLSLSGAISGGTTVTASGLIQGGTGAFTATGSLTLGTASSATGQILFRQSASANTVTLQAPVAAIGGNYTLSIPTIAANDTLCLSVLSNCTAVGAASGALTGTYPGPTLAGVTGTGAVPFQSATTGVLASDSANFFFDNTNNRLGVGTATVGTNRLTVNNAATTDNIFVAQDNGTAVFTVGDGGNLLANNAATGTTGTTEAVARTNVTTVTTTAIVAGFANNDIIFINNAGQDYYTRIVSGAGTVSLVVSPAVSYDASVTITEYQRITNIGATSTDYTTQTNRFFQGYFLGGVVTGAGSTTLSDGVLNSTTALALQTAGTTRLTVESSGNVGIGTGTTSAATKLEVSGIAQNVGITVDAPTGYYAMQYFAENGTNKWHYEVAPTGSGGYFSFVESGVAERMRIATGGNVGIGTTGAPSQLLSVGGTTGNLTVSTAGAVVSASTIRSNSGFNFNGTAGATTTCSGGNVLSNQVVQGGITTGGTCSAAGSGTVTGTGANTQLAFWTAASALSGNANFVFDTTNNRLAVGTATTTDAGLTVTSTGSTTWTVGGWNKTLKVGVDGSHATIRFPYNASTQFGLGVTTDGIFRLLRSDNTTAGGSVSYDLTVSTAGAITANTSLTVSDAGKAAGVALLAVGDDTFFTDVDAANTLGLYSASNTAIGALRFGSGGATVGSNDASSYSNLIVNGKKNTYGGINFRDGGTNLGTFMVRDDGAISGWYNNTDNGWDWYWNDSTLAVGTVPYARLSGVGTMATQTRETVSGAAISYGGASLGTEILGQGGGAAGMTFHRPGAFAAHFGLETDNTFRVGGWSFGAASYRLLLGDGYNNGTALNVSSDLYVKNGAGSTRVHHNASDGYIDATGNLYVRPAGAFVSTAAAVLEGINDGSQHTVAANNGTVCWNAIGTPFFWDNWGRCISTRETKENITDLSYGLETIRQLKPRQFDWKSNGVADFGFIADEVEAVNPLFAEYDSSNGNKLTGVHYLHMSALMAKGIQQLDVQVQANDARLAVLEAGNFGGNISVAGNASVTGTLTVAGNTQLTNLTVNGMTEVLTLTINGKIISKGNAPTAALGQTLVSVLGAGVINSGTDTAGTIEVASGSQASLSGEIADITFDQAYATAPKIVISGNNAKSSKLGAYVVRTQTGFKIVTDDPLQLNQTYSFDYIIIEATN